MPSSVGSVNLAPNIASAFGKIIPEIFAKEIELKTRELGFTRFRDFVVLKEDLSKNPGDQLHLPKVAELRKAQSLGQTKILAGSGQSINTGFLTLQPTEFGDEVQITQYAGLVTPADLVDMARELLARQALKTENFLIRDLMFGSTANKYFAGGVAARTSVSADLDKDDVDAVVERLEANEALKWPGESFMGFVHPFAKTAILNDLVSAAVYQAGLGMQLYAGEIGMYNRVRFIESAYVPQDAYSVAGLASAGTSGITIADSAGYTLYPNLCLAETITFTYTAVGDVWSASGSKSGARKAALFTAGQDPNDPTKTAAVAKATTWTDANATTYDVALAVEDEDGVTIGYDVILDAAAMTGAASDDTATLLIVLHTMSSVFGQRHIAFGVIRPVTFLGAEAFDYGRVLGVAWNAFWNAQFLHKSYGYVIQALR
jgi:N4-gp56 family major capsid protein